jgi:hypothetical protein
VKSFLSRSGPFLFAAALGALFIYGLLALRQPADLNPTFHVASRYVDRGPSETGQAFSLTAVLLDYRAFYLILLALLGVVLVLMVFLFSSMESFSLKGFEKSLFATTWICALALMVWGCLGLSGSGNWMDYEFLSGPQARWWGGWVSGGLALTATLCSFTFAQSVWSRGKGQFLGRK